MSLRRFAKNTGTFALLFVKINFSILNVFLMNVFQCLCFLIVHSSVCLNFFCLTRVKLSLMVGAKLAERSLGLENSCVPDPQRLGTDPRSSY